MKLLGMVSFSGTESRGCGLTEIPDELFGIVVNQTSFLDGFLDGCKI